jgi:hypothetical protein
MGNRNNTEGQLMFTSAAVVDLLLQIDELKDKTIIIAETPDGQLQLTIGDSIYMIDDDSSETVEVEDEVVDVIEETNSDAFVEIEEELEISEEPIEGGMIKDAVKSLLLGGMIKFAKKHLLN